jgi:hypothetical protein
MTAGRSVMELVLSSTSDCLELEAGFYKTSCVVSVSRGGQVTKSGEGGQAALKGDFGPLEELKGESKIN